MRATTLKLSAELKQRIDAAASRAGLTPHAYMVAAIVRQTEIAEQRESFDDAVRQSESEMIASDICYSMEEVHDYVRHRLSGSGEGKKPNPQRWSR
jgi:predicted transcriptional regulator